MTTNYYDRLGIDETATQEEIEAAWKRAVKEKHPDQSDDPDAQQQFIRLKEAYEALSDPETRQRYDELGHDAFVGESGHESSSETEEAYQRDRSSDRSGNEGGVDWRANTRGHEAAEHVWEPGSGPTADTAPPHDTSDAETSERVAAYGLSFGVPAVLTYILFFGAEGGTTEYLASVGVTGDLLLIAVLPLSLLAVIVSERLLDTERRLWESISEFGTNCAAWLRSGWSSVSGSE
ncbi:DnaJ domain-containing protein [Halolamina salina]|uniref:DnaJ domain-containing protein n=1 Tax=Halolamina salina TaxID=1220023 RepID=A0ABD6B4G6_9EURY